MKMPKVATTDPESDIPEVWSPSKVFKTMTRVNEAVSNPSWDEGTPRGERAVMMFVKASSVTLIYKVQRPPLKLVVAGPNIDEAFAALEAALSLDSPPWQADDSPLGERMRKKK